MVRKSHHLQVIDGGSPDLTWKFHHLVHPEIQACSNIDPGLKGDLRAIMRRVAARSARAGEIEHPLQSHPEVGELKLWIDGREYRLFIATPATHPGIAVALHFWRKVGSDDEIKDLQNQKISTSADRLKQWITSQDR